MHKKYTFSSKVDGYNVLFLGAIHGNEQCGSKAIMQVIDKLNSGDLVILKGSVTFIPICNPEAYNQNVRQIEENLNRIIKHYDTPLTYEQKLANELNEYISKADVSIDLHSMSADDAQPLIFNDYPDELGAKIIHSQNIKYVVEGWPNIYDDKTSSIQDLSTQHCAHVNHKTCLTVECGNHFDENAIKTAYSVIINTLLYLDMIDGKMPSPIEKVYIMMDSMYIKNKEGHMSHDFHHLEKVSKGEVLATYDDGSQIICPQDSYVLLPKSNAAVNSEWFYLGHIEQDK